MNELDAAGITDPALRASYAECKRLNSLHGKTYYLATLLLPMWWPRHVGAFRILGAEFCDPRLE